MDTKIKQIRDILVHSCRAKTSIRNVENLNPKKQYYSDDPKFEFFKALPDKCNCKKKVTREKADEFLQQGKACVVYNPKKGYPLDKERIDEKQIVMPVNRGQTPRVDMVARADMERAYNDLQAPFYLNGKILGFNEYMENIEMIHDMLVEGLRNLIVPFKDDPDAKYDDKGNLFVGRPLFPFGPDQRTFGGRG